MSKTHVKWWLGLTAALALATLLGVRTTLSNSGVANAQAAKVRWDIIHLIAGDVSAGGVASAKANDGSKITLTGHGTFVAPGPGRSNAVTGGGTWETFDPSGGSTHTGTYSVTSLVDWHTAPGIPPSAITIDNIDNGAPSAGLAVLSIEYSGGDRGILVVGCHLVSTPDHPEVFEGITASKYNTDYWNREAPPADLSANVTLFHLIRNP